MYIQKMDTVNCVYCGKTSPDQGWTGLCNRSCYYGLSELISSYDKTNILDGQVITYFRLYSKTSHSFICKRNPDFSAY